MIFTLLTNPRDLCGAFVDDASAQTTNRHLVQKIDSHITQVIIKAITF